MIKKNRVLLVDRADSGLFPGGDTVQIQTIGRFLEKKGFIVDIICLPFKEKPVGDVAILFNLTRPYELYLQSHYIKSLGIPYVLFPVYWNLDKAIPNTFGNSIDQTIKTLFPSFTIDTIRAFKYYKKYKEMYQKFDISILQLLNAKLLIKKILENAALIFPNSYSEAEHLVNEFELHQELSKIKVILNGVDLPDLSYEPQNLSIKKLANIEYICCVGGIGPRKNQLNLVKAANITKIPLVIVGQPSSANLDYYRDVTKSSGDNIYFTGQLSKYDVWWVINQSLGHIQPSFIETPGIASLEAGILGKIIGVSDVGPVKEYFLNYAHYCDPQSIESIAQCLHNIYKGNGIQGEELSSFIRCNYQWDKVLAPLPELIDIITNNHKIR